MSTMYKIKSAVSFSLLLNTLILLKNFQIYGSENIIQHYTTDIGEYILITIFSLVGGWFISERKLKQKNKK